MTNIEPPDHHSYYGILLYEDSVRFFLESGKYYLSLLQLDLNSISNDKDLTAILSPEKIKQFPFYKEIEKVERFNKMIEMKITEAGPNYYDLEFSLSHGSIRFMKSMALLYLHHLQNRRDELASKPMISKYALSAVDMQLSRFHGLLGGGVFQNATPDKLLRDPGTSHNQGMAEQIEHPSSISAPKRPVVLDTLEILDPILRKRCLDLFAQFSEDGQHDRLDTIIAEATRILEDRIREVSKAQVGQSGSDLVKYAFAGNTPALIASNIPAEQESVHLLIRGVFGFIRNPSHHALVGVQTPERVLQIVAMIDYLLFVVESATISGNQKNVGA